MDIQKIISEIVSKISGKGDLIAKFTKDPIAAVKELLGIDIDAGQIQEIVKGVTEKLNLAGEGAQDAAAGAVKEGKSFLAKLKSLFGGK